MKVFNEDRWEQSTWGAWRTHHPDTIVLNRGQDFERPKTWPHYSVDEIRAVRGEAPPADGVAPRWGENGAKGR